MPTNANFCPSCGAAYGFQATKSREITVSVGFGSGLKFGVGFALGAALVGLVGWLIGILIVASVIGSFLSGLMSGSANLMTDPHRFEGTGQATSEPLRLAGTIDVEWTANTPSSQGCWHRAAVTREDRAINSEIVVDQQITQATSGTYVLRGLPDARYLIDVGSTCTWSFRLQPRS